VNGYADGVSTVLHHAFLDECLLPEQRIDERRGLEWGEIIRAFTKTDELDRNAQLLLHAEDDSALCGAVQFGQHRPGDVDDLGEHPRLRKPVLPDRGVEYQQHLVDRRAPHHHPFDLAELVHQPGFGVQPAGGVDHDDVGARGDAFVDGVERWISARLRDDGNANANLPRLARLAEVWEKIARAARDTADYNLERKPFVFSVFSQLAEATR